jgi:hypothetical protein
MMINRLVCRAVVFNLICAVFVSAQTIDPFFEDKFDGAWAGYLELEGVQMPLLANFNSQGVSSCGYVFFLSLSEDGESLEFLPYQVNNVVVKPKKVKFEFDILEWINDELNIQTKTFSVSLKYNKKQGNISGRFSVVDPESGETIKGSILLYHMEAGKLLQGLWQGAFPDVIEEELPMFLFLTQNSPVGGSLLLMPKETPLKNGKFENNRLTGNLDITTEIGFNATVDLDLKYSNRTLSGTVGYRLTQRKTIKLDVNLSPAGTLGRIVKVNSVNPYSASAGKKVEITISGNNFAEGAVVHLDDPNIVVSDIKFVGSSKLGAVLNLPKKMAKGATIGVRVVNPDNQQADKAGAVTIK